MKRKRSPLPLCLAGLALCGLLLAAAWQVRMHHSAQKSRETARQLQTLLPERTPGAAVEFLDPRMPALEIDGTDYVGLLEIPAFGVGLPIEDGWKGGTRTSAVRRFWGSAYDRALVVGGPDHPGQFDFCDDINIGTPVTVTDMTGVQFSYIVSWVDRAKRADARWLTESGHALTLFCWDVYALEYVAVRCDSASGQPGI